MIQSNLLLSIAVFLGLMLGAGLNAHSEDLIPIKSLELTQIPAQYRGKLLSAFYVSGREAAIGVSGQRLNIKVIKAVTSGLPIQNTSVQLPQVQLSDSSNDAFNYVLFVVHSSDSKEVYLKNPDGTLPKDPRIKDPGNDLTTLQSQIDAQKFIGVLKLEKLDKAQNFPETVQVNYTLLN